MFGIAGQGVAGKNTPGCSALEGCSNHLGAPGPDKSTGQDRRQPGAIVDGRIGQQIAGGQPGCRPG